MSKGLIMIICAVIGIIASIILMIVLNIYFKKKAKSVLKQIETEGGQVWNKNQSKRIKKDELKNKFE